MSSMKRNLLAKNMFIQKGAILVANKNSTKTREVSLRSHCPIGVRHMEICTVSGQNGLSVRQ